MYEVCMVTGKQLKGETSKIKKKHGLVEFCNFLFPT